MQSTSSVGTENTVAVRRLHCGLSTAAMPDDVDGCLAEIRALEELKGGLAARQASLSAAAHEHQSARDVPRGIGPAETARLVGAQIALARRTSPHRGSRLLGLAHALVEELPQTMAALTAGVIGEWAATIVTRETAFLSRQDREAVDAAIAPELAAASDRRIGDLARAHAGRLDPAAAVARRARAESQRLVTLRPEPDSMTLLSALLPVKDGVACYAALNAAAHDAGHLPRGQVMADALVERVTGRTLADGVDVHVDLLMPIDLLVPRDASADEPPAHVHGYGPIPADLARDLLTTPDAPATAAGAGPVTPGFASTARVQLRRLFTYPGTGDVIAMETRARTYDGLLADLIRARDQACRTPWCGAPIRHIDHIRAHAAGGATSERNGQGLCARCNYIKEHPDVQVTGHAGSVVTRTGGLAATSRPPAPPGHPPPTTSPVERTVMDLVWADPLDPPTKLAS